MTRSSAIVATTSQSRVYLSALGLVAFLAWFARAPHIGADAAAYWAIDHAQPYATATGNVTSPSGFLYAPPVALLAMALSALPWPVFYGLLTALLAASLAAMAGRWSLAWLLFPPVLIELEFGNIDLLLGAVAVLGLRYPALWSVALLTKVTPGVGLLWFAVRREWRSLGIALGATAALALASWIIRPDLWPEWIAMLRANVGLGPSGALYVAVPLLVRLPVAALLVTWGALTDRRWTVPLASMIALPTLWIAGFAMLAGLSGQRAHHGIGNDDVTGIGGMNPIRVDQSAARRVDVAAE